MDEGFVPLLSGIDGAELLVVGLCGEKLIILEIAFHAVHASTLIVPAEFESMAIESLSKAGAEGTVFLLQSRGRERSAVVELALITEDAARGEAAEKIEERVGTSLRVRGAGESRLVTILATKAEDERAGGIAKSDNVTKTEEKTTVTEIRACGGKRG